MSFNLVVFLLGIGGGVLGELLKWYQLKESPNLPEYAKSPLYWIVTVLMALAGGFLAWIWGIDPSKPFLALNVGISAPLILKGLAAVVPTPPGDTQAPASSVARAAAPGRPPAANPSVINFIAGR
jgi:hypothetical protein